MQRYFVNSEQFGEHDVEITGDDARHLQQVMRVKQGQKVICSDGESREALVKVHMIEQGRVIAKIVEHLSMDNEPQAQVWIAQSLPKSDKIETVIQRCTEIGAVRFMPFTSERTIVQYNAQKTMRRMERWRKIAKEAAEQAHRNRIPTIDEPMRWQQVLDMVGQVQLALICYEQETAATFRTLLTQHLPLEKILIIVGPEGGFTADEIEAAKQAGCHSVSLGKRILRTETAAMVALASILYENGEIGGA